MFQPRRSPTIPWTTIAFGLLGVLFATDRLSAQTSPDEKEPKIEGRWQVISCQTAGVKDNEEMLKAYTITFENGGFTLFTKKEKWRTGTYTVDASARPKRLDLTWKTGSKGSALGIYEIKGDRLTVCFCKLAPAPVAESARPKDFSSTKENEQCLNGYRRLK